MKQEKNNIENLPELAAKTQTSKPFTLARIFRKEYGENFISDWLVFLLDPNTNGAGKKPLNIFMELCDKPTISEKAKVQISRESVLDKKSRIDLLIQVKDSGKEFYIAIENKILSAEGEKQTERYAEFLSIDDTCIFLTPTGIEPSDKKFKAISYRDYITKLRNIRDDVDRERQFYFDDFITHFDNYILNDGFSKADCKFISECNEETVAQLKLKKNRTTEELEECYRTAILLRNRYFDLLERELKSQLSKEGWKFKKSSFYIQIFKPEWRNYAIHYEIIIHKHKGLLYPGCTLLAMLHKESSTEKELPKDFKKKLREAFNFKENDSKFNKPKNVLAEYFIETGEIFTSVAEIEKSIKSIVKKLRDMIDNTAAKIDEFIE